MKLDRKSTLKRIKSVLDDNVAASTGKMEDVDVINADVHKFDNFVWYDASSDFERVDDTTFTISVSATGILGIEFIPLSQVTTRRISM